MKSAFIALLVLASCATTAPVESVAERERRLLCAGPTEVIADDDPALVFFRKDEGLSLATRKEALAMVRTNSCDDPPNPEGEAK